MANIVTRPEWYLPESHVTSEGDYRNRRQFLKSVGGVGCGLAALSGGGALSALGQEVQGQARKTRYPAKRNPDFNPDWELTEEAVSGSYNNFYEFSLIKERVKMLTGKFVTDPWSIEVEGLVEKPITLRLEDILKAVDLEERVYRFRCVEAWSMIVPWTGFPLSKLIAMAKPKPEAKFVRFETFNRPDQAPGMRDPSYPWPYFEGLRMDEAMHPLTMAATGIYGKVMPKHFGAPIRLVVPWKYGYKSIKSIVKMQFLDKQPKTFWEVLNPREYPFLSNVNPAVPHPRWSQRTERLIGTNRRQRTKLYNGYADQVAKLYA